MSALRALYRAGRAARVRCNGYNSAHALARHSTTTSSAHPQPATLWDSQLPQIMSGRLWWGFATGLLGIVAVSVPGVAVNGNEKLEPEALKELAADLNSTSNADRERAASMLSGLTVYLEHHDALYTAGIFPALIRAVLNANNVPQVRVIALGSTADLLKDDRAKTAAIEDERFIPTLLQALQAQGKWATGPEEGGLARAHAARALAELCAEPGLHKLLDNSGAVSVLAHHTAELAALSKEQPETKAYSSLSELPGNMVERHSVEDERFSAAAVFGLSSSDQGVQALLKAGPEMIRGIGEWATSNDPILQRYGVGALARTAISSPPAFAAVKNAGCVEKLVAALNSNDPQAQCFAAGTVGRLISIGGDPAEAVIESGAAPQLLAMLSSQSNGSTDAASLERSPAVKRGVHRCALRGLLNSMPNEQFRRHLQRSDAVTLLQGFLQLCNSGADAENVRLAKSCLEAIQEQLAAANT
ncbi:g8042 [Coccomyxa elongata]